MRKEMKVLLTAAGILLAYILWDGYVREKNREKEQHKKALEAEKRAAFIARIKARAQRKAAARANSFRETEATEKPAVL